MAFEIGHAYSVSNLTYCTSFNVNDYITFSRSFYYKNENEMFTNVRKLSFIFDEDVVGFGHFDKGIVLQDENNEIVDVIKVGSVQSLINNSHYLSFVVESDTGTYGWLSDCEINEINVDEINSSIFFCSGSAKPLGFECDYKGNTYQNYINGLDEVVAPITLKPLIDYTLYRCPIKVLAYAYNIHVGWDTTAPYYLISFDITSLVVNQDGKIVDIGNIPFERTTDTTPPGNKDSFRIFCEARLTTDTIPFLFGDVESIESGRVSLIDGQAEVYDDIPYGTNKTITMSLINYHFTEESVVIIKQLLQTHDNGEISNKCERIDVVLNNDGELEITFVGIFGRIDEESFGIYTIKDSFGYMVDEVYARSNPKLVSTELVGVTIDEEIGNQFDYNDEVDIEITTLQGYLEENKVIQVLQDNVDITSQCVITDSRITIPHVRGDISIIIIARKEWELRLTYENNLLHTFNTISGIKNVLFSQGSTINKYNLTFNGETTELTISHPTTTLIVGIGQTRTIIPLGVEINLVDLEQYGSDGVTTLEIIDRKRPIPTDFSLNLYKMNGEKNVVDKTSVLQSIGSLSGTLRESCSITNPIVTIEYSGVPNFNYVYIPNFNRYYFVTEITSIRNDLWSISLKVDVLMSFKDEIIAQRCVVARNEFEFNDLLKDEQRLVQDDDEYEVIDISRSDNPLKSDGYESTGQYVIQVIRG